MKRYHNRVYFEPSAIGEIKDLINKMGNVKPTKHFIDQYQVYGFTPIPSKDDLLKGSVFEYYRDKGKVIKFCVRCTHMSPTVDMVYIVSSGGKVITGWRNCKGDHHCTLDLNLYEKGDKSRNGRSRQQRVEI